MANWNTGAPNAIPAVGGAMDLAIGDTDHGVFAPGPDRVNVLETYGITVPELAARLGVDMRALPPDP